jgi:hypothetical protein
VRALVPVSGERVDLDDDSVLREVGVDFAALDDCVHVRLRQVGLAAEAA